MPITNPRFRLLLLLFGAFLWAAADQPPGGRELPRCGDADTAFLIVNETGRYTLLYDTAYRQAAWVAYLLTREEVEAPGVKRSTHFSRDPEVLRRGWPSASDSDYAHSDFDRGHLLPSADRNGTTRENKTTFYFSNVSPQYPALNRHIWKDLEEQVRRWAARYDSLYVVTGPCLEPDLPRQGASGVGVPAAYFKALLVCGGGRCEAVAFRIPNAQRIEGRYGDYALSVDSLEALLGYDFFHSLNDTLQRAAESSYDPSFWK